VSCGNAAGNSLPVSNRSIIRRSCCYDYAFSILSLPLPRGTPGFVVGSARDNVAGTRIHWARPVRAETNDYRKLPLCASISLFPFLSLSFSLCRLLSENSRYESLAAGQHGLPIMRYDRPTLRDRAGDGLISVVSPLTHVFPRIALRSRVLYVFNVKRRSSRLSARVDIYPILVLAK